MAGQRQAIGVGGDVLPERWLSRDVGLPRFRAIGPRLVVKQSRAGLFAGVLFVWVGTGMAVGGATDGELWFAAFGLVFVAVGVAHLVIDSHATLFLDEDGWHWHDRWRWRPRLIPWSEAEVIVLQRRAGPKTFFGRRRPSPSQDVLRTQSSGQVTLARMLPEPNLRGIELTAESVDLFCHLQHDVAHRLGVRPVPVRVDLGDGGPRVGFVHPCPVCDGQGPPT